MKIRTLEATFIYTESKRREVQTVTYLDEDSEGKYTIKRVYVIEMKRNLVLDTHTNEFLVPE